MTQPPVERSTVADQVLGATVSQVNAERLAEEIAALARQEVCFENAMGHVEQLKAFIGSPETILGNDKTKHGEIAEAIEVHVTNARKALDGLDPTATLDVPGGRTGMVDYNIDGVDFQSKFYNGVKNGLNAIKSHSADYPDFLPSGGKYTIPKDQYEKLVAIANGETVEGLNRKQVENLQKWLKQFEEETGKPFTESIQPSISTYAETQQGVVHETVEKHENELKDKNEELKEEIKLEHEASLAEGLKVSAQAAAIAGGISFASMAWKFHKQGRNIFNGDLTAQDWRTLGVEVGTSAGVAAVTAGGIYVLTNCAGMAAPLAGALASAAKGVGSLVLDYHAGHITLDEFVKTGLYICSETAVVSLGAVAGQALIPIPVIGALIGSLAGKYLMSLAKNLVAGLDSKVRQLETELQKIIAKYEIARKLLTDRFGRLDQLIKDAFSPALNLHLIETSVALARDVGVHDAHILKGHDDLAAFFEGRHALNEVTGLDSRRLAMS